MRARTPFDIEENFALIFDTFAISRMVFLRNGALHCTAHFENVPPVLQAVKYHA